MGFYSRSEVEEAAERLLAHLERYHPEMLPLDVSPSWDEEHRVGRIEVAPASEIRDRVSVLDWELADTPEYQEALAAHHDLQSIGEPPYIARAGEQAHELGDADQLGEFLETRGRKGLMVSRYKGLGEMNADELWDTTMNPDARVLHQVRVDDVLGSDELFSILMGDQVEPRRNFIETHALQVRNLDI
ncbi:MAG: hypothetical protein JRI68_16390 [Deltaproteobacteria bacterium]|nr:hypothetical protein [Deltaproteobacteria bacterium]